MLSFLNLRCRGLRHPLRQLALTVLVAGLTFLFLRTIFGTPSAITDRSSSLSSESKNARKSALAVAEEDDRVKEALQGLDKSTHAASSSSESKAKSSQVSRAVAPASKNSKAAPAARKRKWKPPVVPDRAHTTVKEQLKHKLAIVVPYRDREANLKQFLPIVTNICLADNINFHIFVVEQNELGAFNRAKLCNIGYSLAKGQGYDYVVFHDVDKVPVSGNVSYRWPGLGMVHMASCVEQFDFELPYYSFLGGVVMFRGQDYERFNGMSNFFWGWGAEDDDTWVRMKRARVRLTRAKSCAAGRFRSLAHLNSKYAYPKVDYSANYKMYRDLLKRKRRYQDDGISTLDYKLLSSKSFDRYDHLTVDLCVGDLGRKTREEAGCTGFVLVDPTATTVPPTTHKT